MKRVLLLFSHLLALAIGVGLGIYLLPILTAPEGPSDAEVQAVAGTYRGEFRRDLQDSDPLHWGEGTVSVGRDRIALLGALAPGPDYKLYLSPEFVETEAHFERLKPAMVRVGDVKTFENFVVAVPPSVDIERYTTVIVWCETFSQFISAAKYR